MGKAVIHAGAAGNGQVAKICNNMLLGIHMIGTCEALAMAQKLGLDPQTFYDHLRGLERPVLVDDELLPGPRRRRRPPRRTTATRAGSPRR